MNKHDEKILKKYLYEVIEEITLTEAYHAPVSFTPDDLRTLTVSKLIQLARQVRNKYNVINALNGLKAKLLDRTSEIRKKTPNALGYVKKIEKLIDEFKNSKAWASLKG